MGDGLQRSEMASPLRRPRADDTNGPEDECDLLKLIQAAVGMWRR